MELDTKQKVLVAIYTEYQKDLPDMENSIKAKALGIPLKEFRVAIDKLQNENMINGANIISGGNSHIPIMVFTGNIKMTRYGIEYVEQKLDIEPTLSAMEKVKSVAEKAGKFGWEQIKDITVKILSEIINKTITR